MSQKNFFKARNSNKIMLPLLIGGGIVALTLLLSLFLIASPSSAPSKPPEQASPYSILQERVDDAFTTGNENTEIPDTAEPAKGNTMVDDPWSDQEIPSENQPAAPQQEPPLVLPENMPAPAPIGQY